MDAKLTRNAMEWDDFNTAMKRRPKTTLTQDEEIAWDDLRDSNK